MKLFNQILFILLLTFNLSSNDEVFDEYRIEFIIFEHQLKNNEEILSSELIIPGKEFINFQNPDLQINITAVQNSIKSKISEFQEVFQNIKPAISKSSNKKETSNSSNPKEWFRKNSSLDTLKKLNLKLNRSSKYNVIDSYSWTQNIDSELESKYLHYRNNLYGVYIKFYRNRFLHIDLKSYLGNLDEEYTDVTNDYLNDHKSIRRDKKLVSDNNLTINLKLNKKNDYVLIDRISKNLEINEKSDEIINVYIDEEKRLFNNEIHYFDHPSFGIVISISKI
jgi:hypothetical protein|tara:strand:+ start:4033 stop:4872 length:840 start_codon:yes stop_codon:yes gene_type:complete